MDFTTTTTASPWPPASPLQHPGDRALVDCLVRCNICNQQIWLWTRKKYGNMEITLNWSCRTMGCTPAFCFEFEQWLLGYDPSGGEGTSRNKLVASFHQWDWWLQVRRVYISKMETGFLHLPLHLPSSPANRWKSLRKSPGLNLRSDRKVIHLRRIFGTGAPGFNFWVTGFPRCTSGSASWALGFGMLWGEDHENVCEMD